MKPRSPFDNDDTQIVSPKPTSAIWGAEMRHFGSQADAAKAIGNALGCFFPKQIVSFCTRFDITLSGPTLKGSTLRFIDTPPEASK